MPLFNTFPKPSPDTNGFPNIKSIQSGTVTNTFAVAGSTITVNISPVNTALSVVFSSASSIETPGATSSLFTAVITNQTTITFTRNFSSTSDATLVWYVVEFFNAKSFQTGTTAIANLTETTAININTVNMNKALIYYTFSCGSGGSTTGVWTDLGALYFVNSNTLSFTHNSGPKSVQWYVVELF